MGSLGKRVLTAAFGEPSGVLGRLGGPLTARGNAATEQHLVDLAGLTGSEVVLVVGPGPGVGLRHAGERAARVIGVEPSAVMRRAARRRCADLIHRGVVVVEDAVAADTGRPAASVDVVLSVNNIQLWPDRPAGLRELHRVLRPGGRLLVAVHRRWSSGGATALVDAVTTVGFGQVDSWLWEPPGRLASTAAQLRAVRP